MTVPNISVILPVYNAEPWIGACIESIQAQTLKEWEAIFVIDGSPDGSEDLIRQFSEHDPRIRIMVQENKGQGAARDAGVAHARGAYLFFLDPDDLIPLDALKVAYAKAIDSKADIVVGDYTSFEDGDSVSLNPSLASPYFRGHFECMPPIFQRDDMRDDKFFYHSLYFMVAWMKLFKAETWRQHHIRAPEGITMGEDMVAVKQMTFVSSRICVVDQVLVLYRRRRGSATTKRSRKAFGIFESYHAMRDMCGRLDLPRKEIALMHVAYFHWFRQHLIRFTPITLWPAFYCEARKTLRDFDIDADKRFLDERIEYRKILSVRRGGARGAAAFFLCLTDIKYIIYSFVIKVLNLINYALPSSILRLLDRGLFWLQRRVRAQRSRTLLEKVRTHLTRGATSHDW